MAKPDKIERYIEFAVQYASPILSTLDASTAIDRCHELIMDISNLKATIDAAKSTGTWSEFGSPDLEITSYYAVGFVTCLEWHARSRLVDLLTFKPELATAKDLANIRDKLLSEAIAKNISIPRLIGAMVNVSTFENYCDTIHRVFEALGIDSHPMALANKLEKKAREDPSLTGYEASFGLNALYTFRNHLVHEISLSIVGPYTLRERLTLDEAFCQGRLVHEFMTEIEKLITLHSPETFPNRLDPSGVPIDEQELLERLCRQIEVEIGEKLKEAGDNSYIAWEKCIKQWQMSAEAEAACLEEAECLAPMRYFDPRYIIKTAHWRQRLAYLTAIRQEMICDCTDLAPDHSRNSE